MIVATEGTVDEVAGGSVTIGSATSLRGVLLVSLSSSLCSLCTIKIECPLTYLRLKDNHVYVFIDCAPYYHCGQERLVSFQMIPPSAA